MIKIMRDDFYHDFAVSAPTKNDLQEIKLLSEVDEWWQTLLPPEGRENGKPLSRNSSDRHVAPPKPNENGPVVFESTEIGANRRRRERAGVPDKNSTAWTPSGRQKHIIQKRGATINAVATGPNAQNTEQSSTTDDPAVTNDKVALSKDASKFSLAFRSRQHPTVQANAPVDFVARAKPGFQKREERGLLTEPRNSRFDQTPPQRFDGRLKRQKQIWEEDAISPKPLRKFSKGLGWGADTTRQAASDDEDLDKLFGHQRTNANAESSFTAPWSNSVAQSLSPGSTSFLQGQETSFRSMNPMANEFLPQGASIGVSETNVDGLADLPRTDGGSKVTAGATTQGNIGRHISVPLPMVSPMATADGKSMSPAQLNYHRQLQAQARLLGQAYQQALAKAPAEQQQQNPSAKPSPAADGPGRGLTHYNPHMAQLLHQYPQQYTPNWLPYGQQPQSAPTMHQPVPMYYPQYPQQYQQQSLSQQHSSHSAMPAQSPISLQSQSSNGWI
jgi:hypothetical protein